MKTKNIFIEKVDYLHQEELQESITKEIKKVSVNPINIPIINPTDHIEIYNIIKRKLPIGLYKPKELHINILMILFINIFIKMRLLI